MKRGTHLGHDWYPKGVPDNVILEDCSWLFSSFAFVHHKANEEISVKIGANTGIYDGTFFDLGPKAQVRIGDFSTLVGVIICTNHRVEIGDYCLLAHEVVIADNEVAIPEEGAEVSREHHASQGASPSIDIIIGSNVWIGTGSTILPGADIGDNSIVAAGCVVDFRIPPNTIVAGSPARIVKWLVSPD